MKSGRLKIRNVVWGRRAAFSFVFSLFAFHFSLSTASAQPESVPPPPKSITKQSKERLDLVTDEKSRTVLALELMELHLKNSEKLLETQDYSNLYLELGSFHFLMDNTLDFLLRRNTGSSKSRNNLKRYEIGLRGFTPRLELIRRELPPRYEPYVFNLGKSLRETRTKAIEPQFSDTVI